VKESKWMYFSATTHSAVIFGQAYIHPQITTTVNWGQLIFSFSLIMSCTKVVLHEYVPGSYWMETTTQDPQEHTLEYSTILPEFYSRRIKQEMVSKAKTLQKDRGGKVLIMH